MRYVGWIGRYNILWDSFLWPEKENSPDHIDDNIAKMQTHQSRPTILLFIANCINLPGWAGKICRYFMVLRPPTGHTATRAVTGRILSRHQKNKINILFQIVKIITSASPCDILWAEPAFLRSDGAQVNFYANCKTPAPNLQNALSHCLSAYLRKTLVIFFKCYGARVTGYEFRGRGYGLRGAIRRVCIARRAGCRGIVK